MTVDPGTERPVATSAGVAAVFARSGGEMGRRVADFDWASTPLGPLAAWPQSLLTAVGICLSSRFPMTVWWGEDMRVVYNDGYVPMLGTAKHPALGKRGDEIWPEMWHIIGAQMGNVMASGDSTWSEDALLPADRYGYREEAYFTYSFSPIRDETGRIAGLLAPASETTKRVLGERRMATLRELGGVSTAHAASADDAGRSIVDALARNRLDVPFASLWLLRDDGEVADLIAAFGLAEGSAIAPLRLTAETGPRLFTVLGTGRRLDVSGLATEYAGCFRADPHPLGDAEPDGAVVLPLVQAGGPPFGVLVLGVSPYRALDDAYGGFLELVAAQTAKAITDARAYEEERRRAESLAELDRAKTEFFSNVSHELRTPLTLIMSPSEDALLDDVEPLAPGQRERLEMIRRNAARLRRLVNDMLDFSRIEGGRLSPERLPTPLGPFTRQIVTLFAPAIERAGLRLVTEIDDLADPVAVDREMWEKIVLNLLSNALKFTHQGEIRVTLRESGGMAELLIADTGVGIPGDELPKLFERFHRVRTTTGRSHEGSGIGLALVFELVALHEGEVAVESELDEGSIFSVRVPYGDLVAGWAVAAATASPLAGTYLDEALGWLRGTTPLMLDQTPAMAAAVAGEGVREGTDATRATVLVADDNADLRGMLERILAPIYDVVLAADGDQALEIARAHPPDLVLADVMMPRRDGFELLWALRDDPATAMVPVVFLSARAGHEAAVEGLDAGADDYLVKPFSTMELLARIRANLELARMRSGEAAWRAALTALASDGVLIADAQATIVQVNDGFREILGWGQEDMPISLPHPWWPDPEEEPEETDRLRRILASALETGRVDFSTVLRHRDGHRVWIDAIIRPIETPRTGQRVLVGALRDRSREHAARERVEPVARLLEALDREKEPESLLRAGASGLSQAWPEASAVAVTWELGSGRAPQPISGVDGTERPTLSELALDALAAVRGGERSAAVPAGTDRTGAAATQLAGIAASVDGSAAIWLGFPHPRSLSLDERLLIELLCAAVGLARSRAAGV